MDFSLLADSPLFKGLSVPEIEKILSSFPRHRKKFRSGELIAQNGDQVNSLIIIISGRVKGEMTDFAGRVIKIEDIPAPGALASAFLFGNKNRFPVNVIALTDGEFLAIDRKDFLELLTGNKIILVNFLDMISNRSQFLSEKIKFLNFKTIKGKLAFFILQKAGKENTVVNIGMTQNDLAEFFAVARPSIARAIGEMEDEGLIEAKGKTIRIINRKDLTFLTMDI